MFGHTTGTIVAPFFATLNQTNIAANNNKFYRLQLFQDGGKYYVGTHWGRVGEAGQTKVAVQKDRATAEMEFGRIFESKTGNNWRDRDAFVNRPGKYDLIQIDPNAPPSAEPASKSAPLAASELDDLTRDLIEMVFDRDMFKTAMKNLDVDVAKLPLGKLRQSQIDAGHAVLEQIEAVTTGSEDRNELVQLSSRFFTIIPHSFGRQRPPVIDTRDSLQKLYDLMAVLSDISLANNILESTTRGSLHPTDTLYRKLGAKLSLLQKTSPEYQTVRAYAEVNGNPWKVVAAWRIDRQDDARRFAAHDAIANRKLLWHGTEVAVVAAIMKSGLRIMPHSGGRVGRGVYLASLNEKSRMYTRGTNWNGKHAKVMFLAEAALGREHHIVHDSSWLTHPPAGFDSVVAKGRVDPDPQGSTTLTLDGKTVVVDTGPPRVTPFSHSSFHHSEYLIYDESQHRLRYLVLLE